MATSKAKRASVAARRAKAIQLRLAGLTYAKIADHLGYSSRGAAAQDVARALAQSVAEEHGAVEAYRELEVARVDRLQAAVWDAAIAGDLRAVDTVLKCIDRRARVLGLYAPERQQVLTLDSIDAAIRDLTGQLDDEDGSSSDGVPG